MATSSLVSVYFANASHPQSGSALGHASDAGGGVPFAVRRAGTFESRLRAINANLCVLPALGGAINRRDTDRKSPNRISAKHIGHFAGVPRSLVVSTCRATHGKQNACPHVVVCGAIAPAPSSRHTGHENASALATSTRTTSSHDAMRSASLELARRSALSATKNRKFACKKSAREHERAPRDRRRLASRSERAPRRSRRVARASGRARGAKHSRKSARWPLRPRLGANARADASSAVDDDATGRPSASPASSSSARIASSRRGVANHPSPSIDARFRRARAIDVDSTTRVATRRASSRRTPRPNDARGADRARFRRRIHDARAFVRAV
jgi:hypothetical protein